MDVFLQDQSHSSLPSSVSGVGQLVRSPGRRLEILTTQQSVPGTASVRTLEILDQVHLLQCVGV